MKRLLAILAALPFLVVGCADTEPLFIYHVFRCGTDGVYCFEVSECVVMAATIEDAKKLKPDTFYKDGWREDWRAETDTPLQLWAMRIGRADRGSRPKVIVYHRR